MSTTATPFRRSVGTVSQEQPKPVVYPAKGTMREVIQAYIDATRRFVEDAAALTNIEVGEIANALPDSLGSYRFTICAAVAAHRARLQERR